MPGLLYPVNMETTHRPLVLRGSSNKRTPALKLAGMKLPSRGSGVYQSLEDTETLKRAALNYNMSNKRPRSKKPVMSK